MKKVQNLRKINLQFYKSRYKHISIFLSLKGGYIFNEFFKYLLPQLLSYFGTQKLVLEDFIPKVIENHYENPLLPYEPNNKENMENKDDEINK